MKAERRHELKTNALARKLVTIPNMGQKFAARAVTGALLVIVLFVVVWEFFSQRQQEQIDLGTSLSSARLKIDQIDEGGVPPSIASDYADDIRRQLAEIQQKAKAPALQAEAILAQGDLAWNMANFPISSRATTQESLRPHIDRIEMKKLAEDFYNQAANKFADQPLTYARAELGLATLAEDDSRWEAARDAYKKVIASNIVDKSYKDFATRRLEQLVQLQNPIPLMTIAPRMNPVTIPTMKTSAPHGHANVVPTSATSGAVHAAAAPSSAKPAVVHPATTMKIHPSTRPMKLPGLSTLPAAASLPATKPAP